MVWALAHFKEQFSETDANFSTSAAFSDDFPCVSCILVFVARQRLRFVHHVFSPLHADAQGWGNGPGDVCCLAGEHHGKPDRASI